MVQFPSKYNHLGNQGVNRSPRAGDEKQWPILGRQAGEAKFSFLHFVFCSYSVTQRMPAHIGEAFILLNPLSAKPSQKHPSSQAQEEDLSCTCHLRKTHPCKLSLKDDCQKGRVLGLASRRQQGLQYCLTLLLCRDLHPQRLASLRAELPVLQSKWVTCMQLLVCSYSVEVLNAISPESHSHVQAFRFFVCLICCLGFYCCC